MEYLNGSLVVEKEIVVRDFFQISESLGQDSPPLSCTLLRHGREKNEKKKSSEECSCNKYLTNRIGVLSRLFDIIWFAFRT